ncbi:hypothetical protein DCAR_0100267 [Daucus carota subsp. sativus]|uniref:Uncharacterized protein n=1 Tax=Daucus carota subsp. sativus TaxID=79200 RepID=A0AAF1AHZ3_DAUCS|nr:hypothetical protein DCAR_0100267 [Daucus carota subsp. sativus]
MSDSTDLKIRQLGVKTGVFQQQHSASQRSAYQQLKPGNQFHISSPQLLQPASPQISQHASPQIDQQNMLSALTKAGTPLQSTGICERCATAVHVESGRNGLRRVFAGVSSQTLCSVCVCFGGVREEEMERERRRRG